MRGRVFKRGPSWYYQVDLPPDPATGRRRQRLKGGFRTKRLAEGALATLLSDAQRGTVLGQPREGVGEWLEDWLKDAAPSLHPSTVELYGTAIRSWIVPRIGALKLAQVTPQVLQQLYSELGVSGRQDGNGGLGARSVRLVHQILHLALGKAVEWRLLAVNPADARLGLPRMASKQMQTWSAEEARAFLLATTDDQLGPLWLLLLATGLRRGEALGLRWEDVDLQAGRLSVVQTVVVVGNAAQFSEPKTAAGRRVVHLQPEVAAVLRRHRLRQREQRVLVGSAWQETGLVFTTGLGGVLHPRNVVRAFDQAVTGAGLRRIRIHDLRHTAASLALREGVHPKLVQEMLGHANVAITLNTYSHTSEEMHQLAAERIGVALFGPAPESQAGPKKPRRR